MAAPSTVVFYHYPCPDGVFAALCAHLALGASVARYVPMTVYSKEADRVSAAVEHLTAAGGAERAEALVLDYTGGAAFLEAVLANARAVTILDHHKTAAEDVGPLQAAHGGGGERLSVTLDMGRSGCGIARDHFSAGPRIREALAGDEAAAARTLRMIDLVEDNDLWRHSIPDSKLAALGFNERRMELDANKNPGLWAQLLALDPDVLVAEGRAAQSKQDGIIAAELKGARPMRIIDPSTGAALVTALCVVTAHPDYRSTAGNLLAAQSKATGKYPAVGILAYEEAGLAPGPDGRPLIKVSLRSIGEAEDTTPVSRAFGGGGHKNASSFNVARADFEGWWVVGAQGAE